MSLDPHCFELEWLPPVSASGPEVWHALVSIAWWLPQALPPVWQPFVRRGQSYVPSKTFPSIAMRTSAFIPIIPNTFPVSTESVRARKRLPCPAPATIQDLCDAIHM